MNSPTAADGDTLEVIVNNALAYRVKGDAEFAAAKDDLVAKLGPLLATARAEAVEHDRGDAWFVRVVQHLEEQLRDNERMFGEADRRFRDGVQHALTHFRLYRDGGHHQAPENADTAAAGGYQWLGWEPETDLGNPDDRQDVYFLTIADADGDEQAIIVHRTCDGRYPLDSETAWRKEERAARIVAALNAQDPA
jgi:hypothetical protein